MRARRMRRFGPDPSVDYVGCSDPRPALFRTYRGSRSRKYVRCSDKLNFDQVTAEFLKSLRGKRSQTAFSRHLGYRSNVAYIWEAGRGFPTAAKGLQIARHVGVDVEGALRRFYVLPPDWVAEVDIATRRGVARFLEDLRGKTSIVDLARYSGKTRFAVSRWLKAEAEPRLNEFFQMVECSSLRLVDLLETLVDPRSLPSVRERWQSMSIARSLAYEAPWTQAVLRAMELSDYRALTEPPPGWIARRIGIAVEEESRCIGLLERAGQIERVGKRWEPVETLSLDVRKDPERAVRLRGWWAQVAAQRVAEGRRGTLYTLGGVSSVDLERLRELEKAYFNEVRAIIAQSQPVERVVLAMVELIDLGENEPSPLPTGVSAPGRSAPPGARSAPAAHEDAKAHERE